MVLFSQVTWDEVSERAMFNLIIIVISIYNYYKILSHGILVYTGTSEHHVRNEEP